MRQPPSPVFPIGAPAEAHDPPSRAWPNLTERVAGWSAGRRKTAVFGWLLLVAAIFMAGQALGTRNLPTYDAGQSGQAERVLDKVAPAQYNAYAETVLVQARAPGATFAADPAMRQAVSMVAAALAAQPRYATGIRTPSSAGGQALVSKDGRSALVTFDIPGNVQDVNQAAPALQRAVAAVQARYPDLRIAESGDASITQAINSSLNFSKAEATSVPITLILLLFVFGALVAAGIPVLLALTALTGAIGVLTMAGHWLPVSSSTFEVVVIIGMAVGVDYSLFYLRREREERKQGRPPADALRVAARTSGRTILVSGLTVMAAVSGLFFVGGGPFTSMALGTVAVVGIAVIGSLTVLPALLAWLGPKADAGRIPFLGRRREAARRHHQPVRPGGRNDVRARCAVQLVHRQGGPPARAAGDRAYRSGCRPGRTLPAWPASPASWPGRRHTSRRRQPSPAWTSNLQARPYRQALRQPTLGPVKRDAGPSELSGRGRAARRSPPSDRRAVACLAELAGGASPRERRGAGTLEAAATS